VVRVVLVEHERVHTLISQFFYEPVERPVNGDEALRDEVPSGTIISRPLLRPRRSCVPNARCPDTVGPFWGGCPIPCSRVAAREGHGGAPCSRSRDGQQRRGRELAGGQELIGLPRAGNRTDGAGGADQRAVVSPRADTTRVPPYF